MRKGVSKVSLKLRANKNETILFWDLINFYIQSYTAHLFIAYDWDKKNICAMEPGFEMIYWVAFLCL